MLFRGPGTSKLARIQGAFVTEEEIARITDFWSDQGEPEFEQELLSEPETIKEEASDGEFDPDQDDLLNEAIMLVVETETASVSMIQRRLRVGYTRAGRLIDMLERRGVISGYEGSKPRQVLITQPTCRGFSAAATRGDEGAAESTDDLEVPVDVSRPATRSRLRRRLGTDPGPAAVGSGRGIRRGDIQAGQQLRR